jgi:5-epi-alpha-selinene synthase
MSEVLFVEETRYSVLDDGRVIFRYKGIQKEAPFEVEIRCPLFSRLHEKNPEILEQHRLWARRFDIPPTEESYRSYCDTRLDLLSSYQCYDLPFEAAVIHSHLMTWFFVFDDIMDIDHGLDEETGSYRSKLCKRHLEILSGAGPEEGDPGCIHAFYDYLQKAGQLSGEKFAYWYERMVYHLREYVLGAYWESLIGPTTDANANTAMYLQVRHMAVGVAPCLDLMAIAAGVPGKGTTDNFFIQRLERLTINYSIWVNDLAGLGRDMKRGLGNVILTLQRDHALSMTEATRMVARMCDAELDAFLQVERQLPMLLGNDYEKDKKIYDAYTDVLKRWMRGLVDWSSRSDRYQRLDVDMALQNDASIRRASQKHLPD